MTLASFLEAYRAGLFPMAEPSGPVLWYRPVRRAVLPLDKLRVADKGDAHTCNVSSYEREAISL